MESRTDELQRSKTAIALPDFAAGEFGYAVVAAKTSRRSVFMANPGTGSKIVIQRNAATGHWTYWNATDGADPGGSIIDFVQHRSGENLGQVRKRLRPWIDGTCSPRPFPAAAITPLLSVETSSVDLIEVRRQFPRQIQPIESGQHTYLNEVRGLPAESLSESPWTGNLHADRRGNAVFVHRDRTGVTGWMTRGPGGFRGFSPGGQKSAWTASPGPAVRRNLVIAESAIDAVSFGLLFPDSLACYASTAGQMSAAQRELFTFAIKGLPSGGQLTVAADADAAGERFANGVEALIQSTDRDDLTLIIAAPKQPGCKDWNEVLLMGRTLKPGATSTLFPSVLLP